MGITLTEGHFSTEEEAIAEITERGWHPITIDFPAEENALHWHDFSSVVFVLDGTPRIELEDGTVLSCGAGARIEAPAGVLHREVTQPYRAVLGLDRDPADLTHPINKPVTVRV